MARLDGVWHVERISGPPLVGVSKRIFGEFGWTLVAGVPVGPFRVRRASEEAATLAYLGIPLTDELHADETAGWDGRSLLGSREVSRFRLVKAS